MRDTVTKILVTVGNCRSVNWKLLIFIEQNANLTKEIAAYKNKLAEMTEKVGRQEEGTDKTEEKDPGDWDASSVG